NPKPIVGPRASPHFGAHSHYAYVPMKGLSRRPRIPATATRKVLAANLIGRMAERFGEASDRIRALSDQSGIARSTIQRLLEIDVAGASIDTLSQLANALHCEPYE